jgi:hypothetical protein
MQRCKCGWVPDAASVWALEFGRLSASRAGRAWAMSARAKAQTLRVALICAVLDGCSNVDVHHLRAALEVWRYCPDSVDYCFGSASGDTTAHSILNMLGSTPEARHALQISARFNRNKTTDELQHALATVKSSGKTRSETRKPTGKRRAAEIGFASEWGGLCLHFAPIRSGDATPVHLGWAVSSVVHIQKPYAIRLVQVVIGSGSHPLVSYPSTRVQYASCFVEICHCDPSQSRCAK